MSRRTGSGTRCSGRSSGDSSVPRNGAGVNVNGSCASPAIQLTSALPSPMRTFASRVFRSVRTTSPRSVRAPSRVVLRSPRFRAGTVTFVDGSTGAYEAIICATGYDLDIPYLDREPLERGRPGLRPLPAGHCIRIFRVWASSASSWPKGRTSRCSSCRRDGSSRPGPVEVTLPDASQMRATIAQGQPPLDAHNALALTLAEELGVAPTRRTGPNSPSPDLRSPPPSPLPPLGSWSHA